MQARGRKSGVSETLPDDNDPGSSFLDCAVEIAQAIDNLEGLAEVISLIAIKYVESGQLDVAVDLAETINDSYQRDQAHAALAAKCIEVDAPDYADFFFQAEDGIRDVAVTGVQTCALPI